MIDLEKLRFNEDGLIFTIAQDWLDGAVLMAAWMNKEALESTLLTRQIYYWSRSRKKLWHKGATSGHFQKLKGIRPDCDYDVLLISIEQIDNIACHTGVRSCFFLNNYKNDHEKSCPPPTDICTQLAQVIRERKETPDPGSYTNKLLNGGTNRILKKIGEESAEFVMACKDEKIDEIVGEAADIIFHVQVALAHYGIDWRNILEILSTRSTTTRRPF